MSFDEVSFPDKIAYGTRGGPKYKTTIHETAGGREERTSRWAYARREWDASYGVKSHEDLQEVHEFFLARDGAKRGFRFRDPWDNNTGTKQWATGPKGSATVTMSDVTIGVGNGTTTAFQLVKTYTSGLITKTRAITKPVANTVLVAVNGVAQTESTDYTVNTATGVITFTTAPPNTHDVTAGFEFEVPTRFADDDLDANYDSYSTGSASIGLIEILEDTSISDGFMWGGHLDVSMAADYSLSVITARSYSFDTQSSGHSAILPNPATWPPGGPYFVIHNEGSTHALALKDHSGNTLLNLAAGTSVTVALYVEADGTTKGWIAW